MTASSLQDGIDQAGSPSSLLWKPNAAPWLPEVVESEYAGWRAEQRAWHEGVAFLELSHHMFDTFLRGPDATRLLMDVSANELRDCAVGQAKQFVPVTPAGHIVSDGILLRYAARFGVGTSAGIARKYGLSLMTNLMGTAGPDRFLHTLARNYDVRRHGEIELHFYTFGGLRATADWVTEFRRKES
ncbi:hypothetical protein FHR84_002437 [Actinopolyspora biskrensis]|uniref:GCVT N-terminal domain-containing protein n=1 Tax=Actinopolyspora biskrensis TaxID=1470178 RepID=A0A852ZAJ8_9ACTN|nr:hypothetical protein [Actinopolyspora biskrensis]NYH79103.1 hypothetical protein [Actinopolyspora biskrensis]